HGVLHDSPHHDHGVLHDSPHHDHGVLHDSPHHDHGVLHDHVHRSWKDIRTLIEQSGISAGAKQRALAIFTRLAEAEAHVHGKAVDDVAFHEVGALDSIIDIVGTAICLDLLKPDRITCGELELGGGMVKCAHGILPVPAPATLILIRGMPVTSGGFNKEMTTPTGAAILAASVDEFVSVGRFTEIKTGYGIGSRRMERPNFLRVSWREETAPQPAPLWKTEELVLMEANIDDMSGEALGFLMESLFEAGALDVTFSPCTMKKSRPGVIVACLASPARLDGLRKTLFLRSSTIGFRETTVNRLTLRREETNVDGDFGSARVKTVFWEDKPLRSKVEYDDRARLAHERSVSLEEAERLVRPPAVSKESHSTPEISQ
ncbi:MAG: nickel pincer cofactor biosynthesis protein LarC, partial [Treponema sp.]|nr:nickel pincer cofactor biosynthesis protein LarC [Treponema sp.]